MRKYTVIDLETSIKNRGESAIGKNKADPFVKENKVVWAGWKEPTIEDILTAGMGTSSGLVETGFLEDDDLVIVGQNVKFDLHYLMRDENNREKLKKARVWDTQLAEYLLTGQQSKMISLDKLATKYGGTLKDDRLKEYWGNNIDTEDIPEEEIVPYLEGDVRNTEIVFLGQLKRAQELGMMPLISTQMDALLATTEMEYNGIAFNTSTAMKDMTGLAGKMKTLLQKVEVGMSLYIPEDLIVPNIESKDHLSAVLFGGKLKYSGTEVVLDDDMKPVVYKSGVKKGEVKTRKVQLLHEVHGMLPPAAAIGLETKKAGVYKADEDTLSKIAKKTSNPTVREFIETILAYRGLAKELGTYYGPCVALVHEDGCIHGKLIHVNTGTGRLSSQAPNLQNMAGED